MEWSQNSFLEDQRLIPRLEQALKGLVARGARVDVSGLAQEVSMTPCSVVYALTFHKAWAKVGLDRGTECSGPGITYH